MSLVGAVLAAVSAFALLRSVAPRSRVGRRLEILSPRAERGVRWRVALGIVPATPDVAMSPEQMLGFRLACAGGVGLCLGAVGLVTSVGPLAVLAGAYLGWVAPSIAIAERARGERRRAERAMVVLVERLGALVAAGRPPETALASLLARPTGSWLLDRTALHARTAHTLGAPLFRTLAVAARQDGLQTCAALADDLERARDLGAGSASVLRERRMALRNEERARALEAASTVEGRLMLVLVLCYLPALMLLVVIPLFLSLVRGLGV